MIALIIIGLLALIIGLLCYGCDISYCVENDGCHHPGCFAFGAICLILGLSSMATGFTKIGEEKAYKNILFGNPNPYEMRIQYTLGNDTVAKDTIIVKID